MADPTSEEPVVNESSSARSMVDPNPFAGRRIFTVEQANAALPLVRAIAADMATLSRDVSERRERLAALRSGRQRSPRDVYGQELAQIEEDIKRDGERLMEYVEELRELGVDPKSLIEGLVDFPSIREGRPVFLCWKVGEPKVAYWHDLEAGFVGRQPIDENERRLSASEN